MRWRSMHVKWRPERAATGMMTDTGGGGGIGHGVGAPVHVHLAFVPLTLRHQRACNQWPKKWNYTQQTLEWHKTLIEGIKGKKFNHKKIIFKNLQWKSIKKKKYKTKYEIWNNKNQEKSRKSFCIGKFNAIFEQDKSFALEKHLKTSGNWIVNVLNKK